MPHPFLYRKIRLRMRVPKILPGARTVQRQVLLHLFLLMALIHFLSGANAQSWLAPGNESLRSDLHTLADAGIISTPVTTWPLAWGDIAAALHSTPAPEAGTEVLGAYARLRERARIAATTGTSHVHVRAAVAESPRVIRGFENSPRDQAELAGGLSWTGSRFAIRLDATRASRPADGDRIRLDGSYIGAALGNWMLAIGYQDRWWGPGWDGNLILSTNARPTPQIAINRNSAQPFNPSWLRWLGPWSLTSFIGVMDDDREREDALLFGLRFASRPLPRLEIGVSRTAQFCGEDRPCGATPFWNLMIGRSNRGVNVPVEDEPGNQLAGFDLRWSPPLRRAPLAVYLQWIGEDTRQGGPQIGSWLRQAGIELAGPVGPLWRHRTYVEVSETICREGGAGFSGRQFNCAYDHPLYRPGYRYQGRSVGHSIDGDGIAIAVSTILQADRQRSWQASLRYADIKRGGPPNPEHTLSPTPQRVSEIAVMHRRELGPGAIIANLGFRRVEDLMVPGGSDRSVTGWIGYIID